jgi:hypothetical protein
MNKPKLLQSFPCPCGGTFHVRGVTRTDHGKELSGRCDGPNHEAYMKRVRQLAEDVDGEAPTEKCVAAGG